MSTSPKDETATGSRNVSASDAASTERSDRIFAKDTENALKGRESSSSEKASIEPNAGIIRIEMYGMPVKNLCRSVEPASLKKCCMTKNCNMASTEKMKHAK